MFRLFSAVLLIVAGCGNPSRPTTADPANEAESLRWAPTLAVRPDQIVGWLGVAPAYLPIESRAAAVVDVDQARLEPGVEVLAVPIAGDPVPARSDVVQTFGFGCDGGTIELQTFDGTPLVSGPVWLVPTPLPEGWEPAPIALRSIEAARERSAWQAGPLTVSLTRVDQRNARLEIRAGDRLLHEAAVDKAYTTGSDPSPLDLTEPGTPGIPAPVGVFAIAADGPLLIVLSTHGFEGYTLSALLVGGERVEPVDRLGFYVYQCAF